METTRYKPTELTFQLIVESSPNAIILVNKEGKIAYVNSQTEKLFGYDRTELIGQLVEQLIPERYSKHHPGFRAMFFNAPAVRSMGAGRELFALRKNGSEFPIEIGLNPIVMVDGSMVLASIIDISERKKAEERFRLVVESAPNAMLLVNADGIITLVNKQTEILFGYQRDELVGNKLEMLIPLRFSKNHPSLRDSFFRKPQTRAMGAGRDLFAQKKDGLEVQVEIGLNPIETLEGDMVLASIIDITERKQQELTLKRQVELETKNKELEQFAYVASHDLQEPLRTVSNYMQVLEEDYIDKLDGQALNYISAVKNATQRMGMLIKALMDFSRLGINRKLATTDCSKLVQEVLADLQQIISASKTEIDVSDLPVINIYPTEIRQVFQNLITNAIKFCAKDRQSKISIQATFRNESWLFKVMDNGIGIAPNHYSRIFEIFQRLHTTQEFAGNGIGLANCKKIIEQHQGEIWVESEPGKGSSFFFTIPLLEL